MAGTPIATSAFRRVETRHPSRGTRRWRMRPPVVSSSPATCAEASISRSPKGPTKTQNSPSSIIEVHAVDHLCRAVALDHIIGVSGPTILRLPPVPRSYFRRLVGEAPVLRLARDGRDGRAQRRQMPREAVQIRSARWSMSPTPRPEPARPGQDRHRDADDAGLRALRPFEGVTAGADLGQLVAHRV